MDIAIIRCFVAVFGDSHNHFAGYRRHCQCAQFFRNGVVARIRGTPGQFIAVGNAAHIRDGSGSSNTRRLTVLQATDSRVLQICQRCPIVNLVVRARGDGQSPRLHCQRAVFGCDRVVLGLAAGELIAHHFVRNRALGNVRNRSFHHGGQLVGSPDIVYVVIRVGLSFTIVSEPAVLRFNSYRSRFDGQCSGFRLGREPVAVHLSILEVCKVNGVIAGIKAFRVCAESEQISADPGSRSVAVLNIGYVSGFRGLGRGVVNHIVCAIVRDNNHRIVQSNIEVPVETHLVLRINIPFILRYDPVIRPGRNLILPGYNVFAGPGLYCVETVGGMIRIRFAVFGVVVFSVVDDDNLFLPVVGQKLRIFAGLQYSLRLFVEILYILPQRFFRDNRVLLSLQAIPFVVNHRKVIQRVGYIRNSHCSVHIGDRIVFDLFRTGDRDRIFTGAVELFALFAAHSDEAADQGFRLVIHESADGNRQCRLFFGRKVTGPLLVVGGYGHGHLIDRLIAVRHVEAYLEVVVRVRKLLFRQAHRGSAGAGPGCLVASVVRNIRYRVIQCVVGNSGITRSLMFGSVVVNGAGRAGDGHFYRGRINRLIAVRHSKGHGAEVRVRVLELAVCQTHLLGAGVLLLRFSRSAEREVVLYVIQITVCRRGVAAHAVRFPVIGGDVVRAGDGHGYIDRIDRNVAVRHVEGNDVEVRVRVRKLFIRQAHVRGARVGPFGRRRSVQGEVRFRVQLGVGLDVIAARAVRRAVVIRLDRMAGDGNDSVDLVDRLIAVRHVEGNLGKVLAVIRELFRRQAHLHGAGVGLRRFSLSSEGEVSRLVQRVADLDIKAGNGMRFSVIVRRIVVSGNGHNHFVHGRDRLIAVCHVEGDFAEVRICIGELISRQAHVGGAFIRLRRFGCSVEGEVGGHVVQVVGRGCGVATHAVRFAVIGGRVVCAEDRHGRLDLFDRQAAVRHVEGHGAEVPVRVRELAGRQAHVRGARVGALRFSRSAEGEVCFRIQRVFNLDVIAADAVLFAVVRSAFGMSGNLHRHVDRINHQLTVNNLEGHIRKVGIDVREVFRLQFHVIGARVFAAHAVIAAEGEVSFRIQRIADLNFIAGNGMRCAVVIDFVAVLGNGNCHVDRINLLIAIRYVEGDRAEVGVRVLELAGCQAHVGGTCVGPGGSSRSAEREVMLNVVQIAVCRRGEAAHAVLAAVIVGCVVRADNGYCHVDRINLLIAVCDAEGNGAEVGVGVRELPGSQAHVGGAGVGPCGSRRSAECEVMLHVIQIAVRRRGEAAHAVLAAVVVGGVVRADNGYGHVDRINLLIAVCDVEGHGAEVSVRVRELFRRQAHVRGAGVGPGGDSRFSAECEVILHIVQSAVRRRGIAAHAVLFAVIVGRVVRADNGHNHVDRLDGLIAVRHVEGHGAEVLVRVCELLSRQAHVGGADVGSGCFGLSAERDVLAYVIQIAVRGRGVGIYGVCFAVIVGRVVCADNGHNRVDLVDCLIAVRHVEGDFGKVPVVVLELFGLQTHIGGAEVGPARFSCTLEAKVSFCVQRVADLNVISADAVLFAVVVGGSIVSGNGHNHFVHRHDLLIAVRHIEGNVVEVVVRVLELVSCQLHLRLAGFGPCRCRFAAEAEVSFRVQRVADLDVVFTDAVLAAVIGRGIVMSGDGHRHIDRFDRLVAVRHLEGNGAEVAVSILELAGCQVHVRGACVCALRFGCSAEVEVSFRVQRAADLFHGVAGDSMLVAVIRSFSVRADNLHCDVDRGNRLIAVCHIEGHVCEVAVVVREGIRRQVHFCGSDIRLSSRTVSARKVSHFVQRVADPGYIIAGYSMLGSVVRNCAVMADNRHRDVNRGNCLIAVRHCKCDVAEVVVPVRELLTLQTHRSGAGVCLLRGGRSAEVEVSYRVQRVIDADIISAHAVRFAVIVGRIVVSGNGHNHACHRCNYQSAVRNIESHINVSVIIAELIRCQAHRIGVDIRTRYAGRTVEPNQVLVEQLAIARCGVTVRGMFLSVIGNRIRLLALNGDHHACLRDLQGTVGHVEGYVEVVVVVGELFSRQTHRIGVDSGTLCNILAVEGVVVFSVQRIVDGNIESFNLLLCTVVGLAVLGTLDSNGHVAFGDGQRTVDRRDRVVVGHVFVAVHHLVASSNLIVAGRSVGHVHYAAFSCRYQSVTRQQAAAGHGHVRIAVRRSVIRPAVVRRLDRDRLLGLHHLQLAIHRRYCVVVCISARELVARQRIRDRALAREHDAARYHGFDRVVAYQAAHFIVVVAMSRSVICELLARRRHRHSLRLNRQADRGLSHDPY